MADNFLMFSEVIPVLKPEEEAWIKRQLEAVAVVPDVASASEHAEKQISQKLAKGYRETTAA